MLVINHRLYEIRYKVQSNNFEMNDFNIQKLANLIAQIHPNMLPNIESLLAEVYGILIAFFINQSYLKVARVLIMLLNDLFTLSVQQADDEKKKKIATVMRMYCEINYLLKMMQKSSEMMKKDSTWTEEQCNREELFEEKLKEFAGEDNFPGIPEMVQSSKEAKRTSDLLLLKIEVYEVYINQFNLTTLRLINVEYWRAVVYYIYKEYQKETTLKVELMEKSIIHFDRWVSDFFSLKQLEAHFANNRMEYIGMFVNYLYAQNKCLNALIIFTRYQVNQLSVYDFKADALKVKIDCYKSKNIKVIKRYVMIGKIRPDLLCSKRRFSILD